MTKKDFIEFLESLVWKRMTIRKMENTINEFLGVSNKVKLTKSTIHWDDLEIADYNLIGSTEDAYNENEDLPFCDFDIYVLPTKEKVGKNVVYYITEVGYEFN